MKTQLAIALTATILAGCNSIKVQQVSSPQKLKNEYYYVLPKTAFTFEIPLETTTITVGGSFDEVKNMDDTSISYCVQKFGLDKDVFLKLKNNEPLSPVTKLSAVTFSTIAKPDFDKIFRIKPRRRFMSEHSAGFTYTGDGIASASEAAFQDKTLSISAEVLKSVVSIIAGVRGTGKTTGAVPDKLTFTSSQGLNKLNELVDNYNDFKIGPPSSIDPVVYKERLQAMEAMVKQKFAQVFYKEKTVIEVLKMVYCPPTTPVVSGDLKLFKIQGTKLVINNAIEHDVEVYGPASHSFAAITDNDYYILNLQGKKNGLADYMEPYGKDKFTGYVYNLPASYIVTVKDDKQKVVVSQPVKLPQYGAMGAISKKQGKVSIEWNTETGELKKVSGESKGVSKDDISGGAAALKSAIDEIKGDDETTQLEKEVKLLELKKKRDELKATVMD